MKLSSGEAAIIGVAAVVTLGIAFLLRKCKDDIILAKEEEGTNIKSLPEPRLRIE